jgi:preprotein translocase subunit SecG
MEKLTLIVHILTGIAIIGMILLQQGKGAEAGSFGSGASQTMLGSAGSWNFFSKVTAILATIFFITSFGLAVIAKDRAGVTDEIFPSLEVIEQSMDTDLPEVDTVNKSSDLPE